jgi:muconolactone delta-isomerase
VTHLWKVSGQRVVIGVLELPDAEAVDRALAGLPIIKEIGATAETEVLPIYEYRTFAADLKEQLAG